MIVNDDEKHMGGYIPNHGRIQLARPIALVYFDIRLALYRPPGNRDHRNHNHATTMIDLRSDTVTTPCDPMRRAMATAEVGDDVYDEDPTVKRLEQKLAAMVRHEAGLFFPSGTQSNLVALLSHCQRGDEYIVAQNAHTYRFEAGGGAVLGSIQPQPLESERDGTLDLNKVAATIKADDFHFAKTRLLVLENTIGGKTLALEYLQRAAALTRQNDLAFHLDGARVFNAAVALGVDVAEITSHFDSVSICLSKGLGAPVGSVLCANREIINRARRWRKMVGGGMRQVGVLAAAAIYALDHNITRLQQDHDRAQQLADALMRVEALAVSGDQAHTNMVFISLRHRDDDGHGNGHDTDSGNTFNALRQHAKSRGLLLGERAGADTLRLVTHKHISHQDITTATRVIAEFFC